MTAPTLRADQRARRARLENNADNSSPPGPSARVRRYTRRGLLWETSGLGRLRKCGRTRHESAGARLRRTSSGAVGYAGLITCGLIHACPVCSAKIMAARRLEVGSAIAAWRSLGGTVAFGTLTLRHRAGQPLRLLWDACTASWARVTSGKAWVQDKDRYGVAGWLRIVEVTWGRNGWHVHVHFVLFLDGQVLDVDALQARMFGRWASAAVRAGLAAPLLVGQDLHVVTEAADGDLAAYFTKVDDPVARIALEVTSGQSKGARDGYGTLPHWALLDLIEQGDADALDLWSEWERVSEGRRYMTWSKGLRARLLVEPEVSDEELADRAVGSEWDDIAQITPVGLVMLRAERGRRAGELLDAASVSVESAWAYMTEHLIEHVRIEHVRITR